MWGFISKYNIVYVRLLRARGKGGGGAEAEHSGRIDERVQIIYHSSFKSENKKTHALQIQQQRVVNTIDLFDRSINRS